MTPLSDKLRTSRKAAGLTQGQVAARLGVTRGAVTHWESEDPATRTHPGVESLRQLALMYKVSVAWLLDGELGGPDVPSGPSASAPDARLAKAFWSAVDYELLVAGHQRATTEGADFLTDRSLAVFAAGSDSLACGLGRTLLVERLLGAERAKHLLLYAQELPDADDVRLAERVGIHLAVVRTPKDAADYLLRLP